ncbi:DUF2142 domain-containing protein [Paenarthrobacter sp.]|uniref:DUF2142 domain-containing protein n=1 Tax=Paenarthrobacter sp. TaxID=1931993 RepID=UPI0028109E5E|nr:DUF2142 domain-containing protein [Paenarthrobacter sp.]
MPSTPSGVRWTSVRSLPFLLPVSIFLILGTLTSLWALASPLMTVPDEPAHAIKAAAVVRGQVQPQMAGPQGEPVTVWVPGYFAELGAQTCTAFKPDLTAACAPPIDPANTAPAQARTTAGNYNPLYYVLAGLPSRFLDGAPALYGMRIISGLVSAAFLAMAFVAATRLRHSLWPVTASTVALTPMVLYLSGSINPNSLEIVTTLAFFLNLCLVLDKAKSLSTVRAPMVAVGLSGVALANTRSLSLIWLAAAVFAALVIFGWRPFVAVLRDKLGLAMTALVAAGCAAGLGWLVMADSLKSLGGTPSTTTPDQAFAHMLDATFNYANGYIGIMGWLDTPAPSGVQIFWHLTFGALLLAALSSASVRSLAAILPIAAAVVLLPPILQSQVIEELGYIWQGRYLLALVVLLLVVCGVTQRDQSFRNSTRARSLALWLLSGAVVAHLYVFLYALRRFTVGLMPLHTNWTEMAEPLWQPPLTWQGLSALYLAMLLIGAVLIYRHLFPARDIALPGPATATAHSTAGAAEPAKAPTGRRAASPSPAENTMAQQR